MTDSTLQRVWDSRDAISRRCDYDSHKLVRFYQSRQKKVSKQSPPKQLQIPNQPRNQKRFKANIGGAQQIVSPTIA
jgi:hypothetical protein